MSWMEVILYTNIVHVRSKPTAISHAAMPAQEKQTMHDSPHHELARLRTSPRARQAWSHVCDARRAICWAHVLM